MSSISTRSRLITVAIFSIMLTLALAGPANARPFQTGLLDISAFLENDNSVDNGSAIAFERTKAAGATYVKTNLYWNAIAPDQRPANFEARNPDDNHYSGWAPYDDFVKRATAQGLEPILDVIGSPSFARSACTNDAACSPFPADYGDFAAALAKRYSGNFVPFEGTNPLPRVKYFQAWVEPNLNFFYKPTFKGKTPVAPGNYRGILNAFYDGAKSVNTSNVVISAGLAPLARPGTTIGPLDFMRRLLCLKGRTNPKKGCAQKTKLDVWATHPYTTGGPTHSAPGPDDVSLGDLPEMSNTLKAADKFATIQNSSGKTPFWVTEFSWDSKPPDPGGLPWYIHARWTAEAMYRMYKAGVDTMIWFNLRDEARSGGRPDSELYQSGLYQRGASIAKDKPKRVLSAFRYPFVALKIPGGFHFWGRTPKSTAASIKIQVDNGPGGYKTIGTSRANASGIFEGNIRRAGLSPSAFVRSAASGQGNSLGFSLKYVKDFYQPPFGGNPNSSGPTARATLAPRLITPQF